MESDLAQLGPEASMRTIGPCCPRPTNSFKRLDWGNTQGLKDVRLVANFFSMIPGVVKECFVIYPDYFGDYDDQEFEEDDDDVDEDDPDYDEYPLQESDD